ATAVRAGACGRGRFVRRAPRAAVGAHARIVQGTRAALPVASPASRVVMEVALCTGRHPSRATRSQRRTGPQSDDNGSCNTGATHAGRARVPARDFRSGNPGGKGWIPERTKGLVHGGK